MEFIKPFWDEYGYSIIMILGHGILIGIVIELTVKKLFDTMISRAEGSKKEKLIRGKAIASLIVGAVLTLVATYTIVKSMPLPGGAWFFGFWATTIYIIQYVVSLYGIKYYQKKREEAKSKIKTKVPKQRKRNISIEEGTKVFKQLEDGSFVEV